MKAFEEMVQDIVQEKLNEEMIGKILEIAKEYKSSRC